MLESVDPGGVIAASIEPERVVGCVVYCSTEIVEPGVIRHVEGTRFAIGEPDGSQSERCRLISEAFVAGGLKCPVEERLRDQIWLKLIGNVAFNPVTALTGATLGELGELPEMVELLREIFEECAAVAAALGIELPVSIDRRLEAGFAVGDHKTSMLQDLEAGKPLELGCMTGAVIELADKLDIAVPHTRAVHACATLAWSDIARGNTPTLYRVCCSRTCAHYLAQVESQGCDSPACPRAVGLASTAWRSPARIETACRSRGARAPEEEEKDAQRDEHLYDGSRPLSDQRGAGHNRWHPDLAPVAYVKPTRTSRSDRRRGRLATHSRLHPRGRRGSRAWSAHTLLPDRSTPIIPPSMISKSS